VSGRRRPSRLGAVLLAFGLLAATSACGSARTDEDFRALYAGSNGGQADRPAAGADRASDGAQAAATTGGDATATDGGSTSTGDGTNGGAATAGGTSGSTATGGASSGGGITITGGGGRATGSPIRLGSVGTTSGPIGGALAPGVRAAQAWAAWVNANGGIAGHPVQLVVADDGGDPAKHRSLVQQFVEQRGVVAFLHTTAALSGQSAVTYLESKHIPVIGSEGGSPWFLTSPVYFPQMPSDTRLASSFGNLMAFLGKPHGFTKVAIVSCAEAQGCASATTESGFTQAGLQIVYRARASLAQPDYTAPCLAAKNQGAQMMFVALDGQSDQRLADNCASVDYHPLLVHSAQSTTPAELRRPSMDGAYVGQSTAPWFSTGIPAVAEFDHVLKAFAPSVVPDGSAIQGWVSARLLEAALRKAPDPTTSAGILAGLYAIHGDDLGGLTYPISFTKGAPDNAGNMPACYWVVKVQRGAFVSPDGGQRHCP
jgi:branched-chain amino acid transport system substrate-binding protein